MSITLLIRWYDRRPNFLPDYESPHFGRIKGTPDECMKQYRELQSSHDLSKYSATEIIGVY